MSRIRQTGDVRTCSLCGLQLNAAANVREELALHRARFVVRERRRRQIHLVACALIDRDQVVKLFSHHFLNQL
jgi:hypothetical protein